MNSMSGSASTRGSVSAADVFMVQTELRKMENRLFEEQQRRTIVEIELNTVLNQSSDTRWGAVQPPDLVDIPVSLSDVQTLARANAPLYQSAQHERRHGQTMLRRSRFEFAPDFDLMYGKKVAEAGPDGSQFGIGLSIPLWLRRPAGQYQSAKAHIEEADANAQAMENMVIKMVHMEYVETQTHLTLSRNYLDGILLPAQSNLEISRQRYATGQTDFLRLLEAFRSWIDVHNEFEEQLYHYGEHWAELERWVGIDLSQAKQALGQMNSEAEENSHAH
jgi:outer membrane protein TolC